MKPALNLACLIIFTIVNMLNAADGKLQFSLDSRIDDANYKHGGMYLRLLPENFNDFGTFLYGRLDTDLGADLRLDLKTPQSTTSYPLNAALYRAWLRWSTPQLEVRLGLQELNFGPARILRSLRWFDSRDPLDPLALTQGVTAATARYFWLNNANVWGWGIFDKDGSMQGIDPIRAQGGLWQWGWRFQYPVGSGNLALTAHERKIRFSNELEWRGALDGQWDVGIGIWFEAVRMKHPSSSYKYQMDLLTVGGDYTLDWGNGLYVLAEYQYLNSSLNNSNIMTAVAQLNYPLTLMDQLFIMNLYNNYLHFSAYYLGWQRQYDQLSWQLLAGYVDKSFSSSGLTPIGLTGRQSLQLTLMYSI